MNPPLLFAGYVVSALLAALVQYAGISRVIAACGIDLESREALGMRVFAAATWPARAAQLLGAKLLGRRADLFSTFQESEVPEASEVSEAPEQGEQPSFSFLAPGAKESIFPVALSGPNEAHPMK
jgi:hypothetical protein